MKLTDDQLWSIWNEKFSEEMMLLDFMAVAKAVLSKAEETNS